MDTEGFTKERENEEAGKSRFTVTAIKWCTWSSMLSINNLCILYVLITTLVTLMQQLLHLAL